MKIFTWEKYRLFGAKTIGLQRSLHCILKFSRTAIGNELNLLCNATVSVSCKCPKTMSFTLSTKESFHNASAAAYCWLLVYSGLSMDAKTGMPPLNRIAVLLASLLDRLTIPSVRVRRVVENSLSSSSACKKESRRYFNNASANTSRFLLIGHAAAYLQSTLNGKPTWTCSSLSGTASYETYVPSPVRRIWMWISKDFEHEINRVHDISYVLLLSFLLMEYFCQSV